MIPPRITTRGYYDLTTGRARRDSRYSLYPSNLLGRLAAHQEVCIVVHGMRNDSAGATSKIRAAASRLAVLGYAHPIIGFSYDSNTAGAHTKRHHARALKVAQVISKENGRHLALFADDMLRAAPDIKIRLLGHSLGSDVIMSTIANLYRNGSYDSIETVHLLGASVTRKEMHDTYGTATECVVCAGVTNYYAPQDEVLSEAHDSGEAPYPAGLCGLDFTIKGWQDIRVAPENHRFISYAERLESFP